MKGFLKKINPYQHTVSRDVSFTGIGLHSGLPITMVIKPADADSGINFVRTDLDKEIPALMDRIVDTTLAPNCATGCWSILPNKSRRELRSRLAWAT